MILLHKKLTLLTLFFLISSVAAAQNLAAKSLERTDGTAFFTLDKRTGQLYYMLDYGSNAGNWKSYGGLIRETGSNTLEFQAIERVDGSAFFAMDATTGQVYFMLDYGSNAGNWKSYGGTVPKVSNSKLTFQATSRTDGTAFFAIDSDNGQTYYMLDYGSNAGNWKSYGGIVP